MIKGDIDLTENMDFYHERSVRENKCLRTIPWEENKPKTECGKFVSYYIDNTFSSPYYWHLLYNSNTSYYIDDVLEYSISTDGDGYDTLSYSIHYNTNQRSVNYNTIEDHPEYYITTYNNSANLSYNYIGGGDIFDKIEDKFPWKRKSRRHIFSEKLISRRVLTDNNSLKNSKNCLEQFENKKDLSVPRTINLSEKHKKPIQSKRGIPWYDNLEYRIYEDYIRDLNEETDYSRYLTNRGWLGLST